jgi:hypothetical protein
MSLHFVYLARACTTGAANKCQLVTHHLILVTLSMVAALKSISIFENRGMPDML